jgi:hypothetical protein
MGGVRFGIRHGYSRLTGNAVGAIFIVLSVADTVAWLPIDCS